MRAPGLVAALGPGQGDGLLSKQLVQRGQAHGVHPRQQVGRVAVIPASIGCTKPTPSALAVLGCVRPLLAVLLFIGGSLAPALGTGVLADPILGST